MTKQRTKRFREFESIALTEDLPGAKLEYPAEDAPLHAGDEGVIVDDGHAPDTYLAEFFRDGETIAIAEVRPNQITGVIDARPGPFTVDARGTVSPPANVGHIDARPGPATVEARGVATPPKTKPAD
jgi:hypothetical protein